MGGHGITIPMKDIEADPKALEELLERTGRYTVPCLLVDQKPMYESQDIISWLSEHLLEH